MRSICETRSLLRLEHRRPGLPRAVHRPLQTEPKVANNETALLVHDGLAGRELTAGRTCRDSGYVTQDGRPGARHRPAWTGGGPGQQLRDQRRPGFRQISLPWPTGTASRQPIPKAQSAGWRDHRGAVDTTTSRSSSPKLAAWPARPQRTTSATRPRGLALLLSRELREIRIHKPAPPDLRMGALVESAMRATLYAGTVSTCWTWAFSRPR